MAGSTARSQMAVGGIRPLSSSRRGRTLTGNLRRNLMRAQRNKEPVDRALFATSRRVTPSMRQKLEAEARKLDVTLLQIYDQDWFAQRLYGGPIPVSTPAAGDGEATRVESVPCHAAAGPRRFGFSGASARRAGFRNARTTVFS